MLDKIPQVFISYSWTSEVYKQKIKEIAERLMHDGIMVKLDVWDLKDGQDNHYFQYIELLDNLLKQMNVLPDQKELFLFYYNLYYKFSDTE
jgi:hypothetical protein